MKLTHTKKKDRAWTLVLETEEEATLLKHVFGCKFGLGHCDKIEVRSGRFHDKVFTLCSEAGIRA